MNKLFSSFVVAALWISCAATTCVGQDVIVNGGILDLEGTFGTGQNISFIVVDFGGTPEGVPGPRDSFAFGYRYDDPDTTAAVALQGIAAEDSGLEFDFGGNANEGFGLFINGITFGDATDFPDFSVDGRFWNFFNGTLENENEMVQFAPAETGISGFSDGDGVVTERLVDGSFSGFRAQGLGSQLVPVVPVTAVPEPSSLAILSLGALTTLLRRRKS